MVLAVDDGRIVERSCINRSCRGAPLLREADVGSAVAAEAKVQPSAGFVDGAVIGQLTSRQFEVRLFPFRDHRKCGASSPLTPFAVAHNNYVRVTFDFVSDIAA